MKCKNIEITLLNCEIVTIDPCDKVYFKNGVNRLGQCCKNVCQQDTYFTEDKLLRYLESNCNGCGIIEIKKCHETIDILTKQICTVRFIDDHK